MSVGFRSVDEFKEVLEAVVGNIVSNDIADAMLVEFSDNANKDVYDVYDPYMYKRSYRLNDPSTYGVTQLDDMSVEIAVDHPYGELIEYGHNTGHGEYQYPFNRDDTAYKFLSPRPFYRHTVEKFGDKKYFKELLASGLRAQGYTVK